MGHVSSSRQLRCGEGFYTVLLSQLVLLIKSRSTSSRGSKSQLPSGFEVCPSYARTLEHDSVRTSSAQRSSSTLRSRTRFHLLQQHSDIFIIKLHAIQKCLGIQLSNISRWRVFVRRQEFILFGEKFFLVKGRCASISNGDDEHGDQHRTQHDYRCDEE